MIDNISTASIITIISIIILSLSLYHYPLQKSLSIININHNNSNIDGFGIREIYSSKSYGEKWHIDINDPNNDSRTDPKTTLFRHNISNTDNNSWKLKDNETRYDVFTSSGYHPQLITTLNQTELSKRGYIQSPNDWKNVEMTGYFKINHFINSDKNGLAHIELVARGKEY